LRKIEKRGKGKQEKNQSFAGAPCNKLCGIRLKKKESENKNKKQ
jgi:hypothetical protein